MIFRSPLFAHPRLGSPVALRRPRGWSGGLDHLGRRQYTAHSRAAAHRAWGVHTPV